MNELRRLLEKHRELVTFVIIGGINTLVTGAVFIAISEVIEYELAYALTYVLGIALSYWMNSRWVFRVPMTWKKLVQFPLVYLAQWACGAVLLYVFVEGAGIHKNYAAFLIPVVTVPITFVISRVILKTKPRVTEESAREDA